jgi:hypothetical protein
LAKNDSSKSQLYISTFMQNFYFKSCSRIFLLLVIFFFSTTKFNAQSVNASLNKISLTYNGQLDLREIKMHQGDQFNWALSDTNQNVIITGNQSTLPNYLFSTPGKFLLQITALPSAGHLECNHGGESGIFEVSVSALKVVFDISQITFLTTLDATNLVQGVDLTIPMQVSMFNTLSLNTSLFKVRMQGVDCSVQTDILNPQIIQTSGNYELKVHLQGQAKDQSYIMIDFIDHLGNISTYYHPTEL